MKLRFGERDCFFFLGKSGQEVVMNCNGQRTARYALLNVNSSGDYEIVGIYATSNKSVTSWTVRWPFGEPSDTPKCGFDLSKCPSRSSIIFRISDITRETHKGYEKHPFTYPSENFI